jgi:hypothetical protein
MLSFVFATCLSAWFILALSGCSSPRLAAGGTFAVPDSLVVGRYPGYDSKWEMIRTIKVEDSESREWTIHLGPGDTLVVIQDRGR